MFALILHFIFSSQVHGTLYDQSTAQFVTQINDHNSAVALMLPVLHILPNGDGSLHLESFQMENTWNLCLTEPMAKAPPLTVACSGFLIAPDILVTAGHCMVNFGEIRDTKNAQCEAFSFLFGYRYEDVQNQQLARISGNQVAHCKKVIYAVHQTEKDKKTGKLSFGKDIAFIQLDRKMPYKPLTVTEKSVSEKDFASAPITMQGYPFGMPMVESKGVSIEHKGAYLRAAINSFPANSGSVVKNKSDEVIGILVRGYPEGVVDDNPHKCSLHNRCDAKAEKCTRNDPLEKAGEHVQLLDQNEVRSIIR